MIKILLTVYLIIIMLQPVTASLLHRDEPPAMTDSWSEVEMVYYRYFPDASRHHYRSVGECTLRYKRLKKDTLKIPDVLRCRERIKLLMLTSEIKTWKQKKKQQSYINLHVNSYNREVEGNYKNTTTPAHIISIKPFTVNSQKLLNGKDKNIVTGLFVQHAVNVRRYTFKDVTTGKKDTVNATANHPFYVKNRSAFMPIEKVTSSDNLITETGQSVRLICSGNRKDHCGVPYGDDQPQLVYNLQVAHRHTYFVGKNHKILVHNCTEPKKPPIQTLRKVGDHPPDPKLVPYQDGGNCASIAICAALQEARHWHDVPDYIIRDNYQSYILPWEGESIDSTNKALNEAGIKTKYFPGASENLSHFDTIDPSPGNKLVDALHRTETELAVVSYENDYLRHMYMVIKSDDSPTGYLELNRISKYSREEMKYEVLPDNEIYKVFIKILPK